MLKKFGNFLVLVFVLIYLLAYLAPYVNPASSWFIALLGLAFPYLFLGGIILLIFLFSTSFKSKWILLAVLIPGVFTLNSFYRFSSGADFSEDRESIKVLSYNVRSFNRYRWIESDHVFSDILRLIKSENPDVVFFQEFYAANPEIRDSLIAEIQKVCGLRYYNSFPPTVHGKGNGLYTFSKYPLSFSNQHRFSKAGVNGILESKLKWGKHYITLINYHLASYQLSQMESGNQSNEEKVKGAFYKLRSGMKSRSQQVSYLLTELAFDVDNTPVICGGDLNDTPHSYAYRKITNKLQDSYKEAGSGEGKTYVGQLPGFRIDYLFHNQQLEALDYHTIREVKSDHYPVVVRFGLQE